jgi:molybdenum cofactor biosynthesis enzyme MoaA
MDFLWKIAENKNIEKINLTTNGVLTAPYVPELKALGISSVNLSLDSLDRQRFAEMTRRDELPNVLRTLDALIENGIPTKINTVVMAQKNDEDILSMADLGKDKPVSVRFIEEMPFNGVGLGAEHVKPLTYQAIIEKIRTKYPDLHKIADEANSTSYNYQIPGHKGTIGVIAAFSRTFCGTCNRIRITPTGSFKTCLYEEGGMNVRDMMRKGASDEELKAFFFDSLQHKAKDGFEAESQRKNRIRESMTTIGG